MSEKIIQKLDAIEEKTLAKQEEIVKQVDEKLQATVASFDEKVQALEAKVASVQAPAIIKVEKTVRGDVKIGRAHV